MNRMRAAVAVIEAELKSLSDLNPIFMATTDIDQFRQFVFNSSFLEKYAIEREARDSSENGARPPGLAPPVPTLPAAGVTALLPRSRSRLEPRAGARKKCSDTSCG